MSEQDQALLDGTVWNRVASGNDSTRPFFGFSGVTELEDNYRLGREVVGQIRDGLSIIERSDTAAHSVVGIVLRMREIAIHACSDTFEGSKRRLVAAATVQFREQLDSISNVTEYNGIQLANGSNTMLSVQAGTCSSGQDRISITLADLGASSLFHGKRIDLSTVTGSRSALDTFDSALETIRIRRQKWKSSHHELDGALNRLRDNRESNFVTDTRIVGSDFALEAAMLASEQVKLSAMQAVNAQLCAITKGVFQLLG